MERQWRKRNVRKRTEKKRRAGQGKNSSFSSFGAPGAVAAVERERESRLAAELATRRPVFLNSGSAGAHAHAARFLFFFSRWGERPAGSRRAKQQRNSCATAAQQKPNSSETYQQLDAAGPSPSPHTRSKHRMSPEAAAKRRRSGARSVPALDWRQVDAVTLEQRGADSAVSTLFDQGTQLHYELAPQSVPVFHLPGSQGALQDPLRFYESVRPLGERYGAVKVHVPPASGPRAPRADHVWFPARTQSLRPAPLRRQHVLQFHRRLYECHARLGRPAHKVPSIDKRTLDLHRLWQCVQLRGGYHAVCQRKLWAQIGRELGYSGRIMSSLSTSLRSAYAKVLLDLERDAPRAPAAGASAAGASAAGAYPVAACADECCAMRDVKRLKGLRTNFGPRRGGESAATAAATAAATPACDTLPGYDWEMWQTGMEIYDSSAYVRHSSPVYNLRQYYEKSQAHLEYMRSAHSCGVECGADRWDLKAFEKWYFGVLAEPALGVDVDSGVNLSRAAHNFGKPSACSSPPQVCDAMRQPWHLPNIPLHRESLLRYLDLDWSNSTHSALDVGMLFSTRSWSMEPMCMPSLTYVHSGSTKLWYVIAPEHRRAFENLVRTLGPSVQRPTDTPTETPTETQGSGSCHQDLDPSFQNSDIYKSFQETSGASAGCSGRKAHPRRTPHWLSGSQQTFAGQTCAELLPGDLQISPEFLEQHGIKVFTVTQECGSYIFKFPQSYTSTVDSSFCVSERARFAPASWLDHLPLVDQCGCHRSDSALPSLLPFQLLMNITSKCRDSDTLAKCKGVLEPLIRRELYNRKRLSGMSLSYVVVDNIFDFVSDVSLRATGASKIVVSGNGVSTSLSLDEFFERLAEKDDDGRPAFDLGGKSLNELHVSLHKYYSDSLLLSVLGEQRSADSNGSEAGLTTAEDLNTLVNVTFKDRRVPVDHLKKLLSSCTTVVPKSWQDVLLHAETLRRECCLLLNRPLGVDNELATFTTDRGLNLVELRGVENGCELEHLQRLQQELQRCSVDFPEMNQIFQLCEEVSRFQSAAEQALRTKELQDLKQCYSMGYSCGIKSKYMNILAFWICRLEWSRVYEKTFVRRQINDPFNDNSPNYSLAAMEWFLAYGTRYCGPDDMDKLHNVKSTILNTHVTIERIKKLFKGKRPTSKYSVKDIASVLELIDQESLPIDAELVKLLKAIVDSIQKAKSDMVPLQNALWIDEPLAEQLRNHLRANSLEALNLLPKFNGGQNDKRLCIKDAAEGKVLAKFRKPCKQWLAGASKLLGKGNLEKFSDGVSKCLDVELDLYRPAGDNSTSRACYCFCRQDEVGGTMVECEACKEWYHTRCLRKGNWKLPEESTFICSMCSGSDETPQTIEYSSVVNLVTESLDLKLLPDRDTVSQVFDIYSRMLVFRNKMESVLFRNGQVDLDIPIHKIKYFLRKAEGCKCDFGDLTRLLKDRCQSEDVAFMKSLSKDGAIVVAGYPPHIIQETSF